MMEIIERLRVGIPCVNWNILGIGFPWAIYPVDWPSSSVSSDATSGQSLLCLVSQVINRSKALAEHIVKNWLGGKQALKDCLVPQVSRLDEVQKILTRTTQFGIVLRLHALHSLLEAMRTLHFLLTDFVANNFRQTNAVKRFLFENSTGNIFREIELRNPAGPTTQQPSKSVWRQARRAMTWALCRKQKNRELLLAVETCGKSLVKLASATITSTSSVRIDPSINASTQTPDKAPVNITPECHFSIDECQSETLRGWTSGVDHFTISIPLWVFNSPR